MEKIRLAVIGSCATRDSFNQRFNPAWRDLYDVVATMNQTSLITLMDQPATEGFDQLDNLAPNLLAEAKNELDKSFLKELVEARPDYILFDFFTDAHFGVVESGGRYFTNNRWKIARTTFFQELPNKRVIELIAEPEEYLALWRPAANKLVRHIRRHLPEARMVMHSARKATNKVMNDGRVLEISDHYDIPRYNKLWAKLDRHMITKHGMRQINLFDEGREIMSFEGHPWKAFFVHYQMDYYARFLQRLNQIVVEDLQEELVARSGLVDVERFRRFAATRSRALARQLPAPVRKRVLQLRRTTMQRTSKVP